MRLFATGGLARVFPRVTGVDSRTTVGGSCCEYCTVFSTQGTEREREREKEWERRKHWLASHDALAHGRGRVVTRAHMSPFLGSLFPTRGGGGGGTVNTVKIKRRVLLIEL